MTIFAFVFFFFYQSVPFDAHTYHGSVNLVAATYFMHHDCAHVSSELVQYRYLKCALVSCYLNNFAR